MNKEWLLGKTLSELESICVEYSMPRFTAKQIAEWIYKKGVTDIIEMTNISVKNRDALSEKYIIGNFGPINSQKSVDGTKKYLFPTLEGNFIESAYIPDKERATLCVSSQAGCRMGCRFCMTARGGFNHNLSAGEIINQIRSIPESEKLTNIVYMGMGEPLDNIDEVMKSLEIMTSPWGYGWSPSRITLSTIGVNKNLERFLRESNVHLAISLHNPFSEERKQMMPVENGNPIHETIEIIKKFDFSHQRRVSFEYILFEGLNDSAQHIKELSRLLNGLKCRINLIKFHTIPNTEFIGASSQSLEYFRDSLNKKGIIATIRASRGEDIFAACGMLSAQNK